MRQIKINRGCLRWPRSVNPSGSLLGYNLGALTLTLGAHTDTHHTHTNTDKHLLRDLDTNRAELGTFGIFTFFH